MISIIKKSFKIAYLGKCDKFTHHNETRTMTRKTVIINQGLESLGKFTSIKMVAQEIFMANIYDKIISDLSS
jgi:hypothetical protein